MSLYHSERSERRRGKVFPPTPRRCRLCAYKARGERAWGQPPPSPRVAKATFSGPTSSLAASFSPRRAWRDGQSTFKGS